MIATVLNITYVWVLQVNICLDSSIYTCLDVSKKCIELSIYMLVSKYIYTYARYNAMNKKNQFLNDLVIYKFYFIK